MSEPEATERPPRDHGPLPVNRMLLELLVCPLTKSVLKFDRTAQELISSSALLAYPIRDGIPIMLPDEARKIDPK
jgi:uncharacterized protein YbaR (Trm112 family)